MATTQLGLSGTPQARYAPFQPKGAVQAPAEAVTGLGLYGGPRAVYLAFLPKTAAGVPAEPPVQEQVGHGGGGGIWRSGDADRIAELFTVRGRVRARAHAGVMEALGTVTNPAPATAIPTLTIAAVPTPNVLHGRVAATADAGLMAAHGSVGMGTEELEDIAIAALADEWWEDA